MVQTAIWHDAADFACRQHSGHHRRDGVTPYIAHPFRVAMTVATVFGVTDDETLAAALLHDTLEDTRTDFEDLERRYGPGVASLVSTLSDNKALRSSDRTADYHARLRAADWRAVIIKLADAHDNLLDSVPPRGSAAFHQKTRDKARVLLESLRSAAAAEARVSRAFQIVSDLLARLDAGAQQGGRGSGGALESEKGGM